ncbi:MAG: flagellar hook-length control protein FliK [Pseudobutyrivibrio sp.]|nr:flagellar hook-length control protein FliK [Pseudobutyrivibrio sp.]
MTSSNVSKMLVQVNSISVEMPDLKTDGIKTNSRFEQTLQNVADSNAPTKPGDMEVPKPTSKADIKAAGEKMASVKEVNSNNKEDTSAVDTENLKEKVDEACNEVKEIIEEELNVTEEEIEEAMETLGLTMIDLFNPQNLAELVATLTGQEDSISLVMSEEFKNILDSVTVITDQLFKETGMNFSDVKDFVISLDINAEVQVDLPEEQPAEVEPIVKADIPKEQVPVVEMVDESEQSSQVKPLVSNENNDTTVEENPKEVESNVEIKLDNKEGFDSQQQKEFSSKDFTQQKTVQDIPKEDAPVIRAEGFAFAENRTQVQFIPEEQIVYLPSGETVTAEKIVSQLVEQARILNNAETTTMEMTLNPEGLGRIYMEVTQKGDEITARIFTENDAVKQALEAQMANMKVEMNQSSTKVTSIEVSVGTHEFERNLEEDAKGEERREEQSNNSQGRSSKINLNNMDELSGLMSEEDILIAQMMKDNGNTLDFQA